MPAEVPAPSASARPTGRHYVMCPPTYFSVRYSINPWMQLDEPVDADRAVAQWQQLHDQLVQLGHTVHVVPPQPDLPDMVFTANGGIVIGDRALVPRFRHAERAAESAHFAAALDELGISEIRQARHVNEGEGDFLLTGPRILAGSGFRSDRHAADEVGDFFAIPVVTLTLVDPRFYHLDTALARLTADTVAYWSGAFDVKSRALLSDLFPDAIMATEDDAAALGLNMVSDSSTVIMAPGRETLARQIAERGLRVVPLPTDELRKAGGGAKCCVLEHHRAPVPRT
jgi:N-dimethylarginine dimethylaminohydrolase